MEQRNRLQQTIRAASMRPEMLPKQNGEYHLEKHPEGKTPVRLKKVHNVPCGL